MKECLLEWPVDALPSRAAIKNGWSTKALIEPKFYLSNWKPTKYSPIIVLPYMQETEQKRTVDR